MPDVRFLDLGFLDSGGMNSGCGCGDWWMDEWVGGWLGTFGDGFGGRCVDGVARTDTLTQDCFHVIVFCFLDFGGCA